MVVYQGKQILCIVSAVRQVHPAQEDPVDFTPID